MTAAGALITAAEILFGHAASFGNKVMWLPVVPGPVGAAAEEEAPEDEAADADEDGRGEATPRRRRCAENASGRISAAAAAEAGLRSVVELTGKQPDGVTAVAPTDDGWLVGVEVLEAQHVPSSSDTHRVPS